MVKAVNRAREFLKDKDGLMLSGNSAMVDPRLYGEHLRKGEKLDLERSIAEMALIAAAEERGIPIMAVCGGHQILNVYHGGLLAPLSEKVLGSKAQKFLNYSSVEVDHTSALGKAMEPNRAEAKNLMANLFGAHKQMVTEMGGKGRILDGKDDLFIPNAHARNKSRDFEGMENKYGAYVISTQFHPEVGHSGLVVPYVPRINIRMYKPETPKIMIRNRNIIGSFVQAANSYQKKKEVMDQLSSLGSAIVIGDNTISPRDVKRYMQHISPKTKGGGPTFNI
jgi:gamma-glutamyl-gamma-aminobutyrate hydrolase PuuD